MKKGQNLPNKNIHNSNSSGKRLSKTQIILDNNHLIIKIIEEDHQIKEIQEISHKTDIVDQIVKIVNIEINIRDQIQIDLNFRFMPITIQILEINMIQTIDLEPLHKKEIEIIPIIGIETIQMIEILAIKKIDHVIVLTTGQTIKDQITNKIDHPIIHRIETQVITIE